LQIVVWETKLGTVIN